MGEIDLPRIGFEDIFSLVWPSFGHGQELLTTSISDVKNVR